MYRSIERGRSTSRSQASKSSSVK
uniref:Uncharacterized protein n=1 Tax=Arundo donax TaxID=35708 RepID=A0A0A9HWM0_ARUDO